MLQYKIISAASYHHCHLHHPHPPPHQGYPPHLHHSLHYQFLLLLTLPPRWNCPLKSRHRVILHRGWDMRPQTPS